MKIHIHTEWSTLQNKTICLDVFDVTEIPWKLTLFTIISTGRVPGIDLQKEQTEELGFVGYIYRIYVIRSRSL